MQQFLLIFKCVFIILYLPVQGFSQTKSLSKTSNGYVWNAVHFKKSITDNLTIKSKISSFNVPPTLCLRFIDVGLNYEITKQWKIGGFYRFRKELLTDQNRMYIETQYKNIQLAKTCNWRLTPRIRIQKRLVEGDMNEEFNRYTGRLRLLFSKKLETSEFEPFFGVEGFYNFKNTNETAKFARFRLTVGAKHQLDSNNNIKFFYRYERKKYDVKFIDIHSISAIFKISLDKKNS